MKVGDLVKCATAKGSIGIITEILDPKGWKRYTVLVVGYDKPSNWRPQQLEVINESR